MCVSRSSGGRSNVVQLRIVIPVLFIQIVGAVTLYEHSGLQAPGSGNDAKFLPNGRELFFGDVLLSDEQVQSMKERSCLVDDEKKLWPKQNGRVLIPYCFSKNVSAEVKILVERAVKYFQERTCIEFEEVCETEAGTKVLITDLGTCASTLGKQEQNNEISLASPKCEQFHTVVHALVHVLGFNHEQNRPDRDENLVFIRENVNSGDESFTVKNCRRGSPYPYDLNSIMQGPFDLGNEEGRTVFATNDVTLQYLLRKNKHGLSFMDQRAINTEYGCIDEWKKRCSWSADCQNDGYVGRDCECVCPPGTAERFCDMKFASQYPDNSLFCGGRFNYPRKIKPLPKDSFGQCIWLLEAPQNKHVLLTVRTVTLSGDCSTNSITFKTDDPYRGKMYCTNEDLQVGMRFQSSQNVMVVHWNHEKSKNGSMFGFDFQFY